MEQVSVDAAVSQLATDKLSMSDLEKLKLRLHAADSGGTHTVERYALAAVIQSIINYLIFVGTDLEKSIGLRRSDERERILETFGQPTTADPRAQVEAIISQWDSMEQFDQDAIERIVEGAAETPS